MLKIQILEDHPDESARIKETCLRVMKKLGENDCKISTYQTRKALEANLLQPSFENVYILDIALPGNSEGGLEASRTVRQHDSYASIIFLTVHDEFLPTTYKYQVEALDFIDKRENTMESDFYRDFRRVIEKANENDDDNKLFLIHNNDGNFRIPVKEILFFTSNPLNSHQSILQTKTEQMHVNENLKGVENLLDSRSDDIFFKVHRSYVINLLQVAHITGNWKFLQLKGSNEKIRISRDKINDLRKRLKLLEIDPFN